MAPDSDLKQIEAQLDPSMIAYGLYMRAIFEDVVRKERETVDPEYLKPRDAAVYLQTTECALQGYRARGDGPKFSRRGNNVRYKMSWLDAWMEEARVV